MVRFVVRPQHIWSTPKRLAEAFNAKTRNGSTARNTFDYGRDLFLFYPDASKLREPNETYRKLSSFASVHKLAQRHHLHRDGLLIPHSGGRYGWIHPNGELPNNTTFIVRPLHHYGGQGWRTTTNPNDFEEGREYIQELFPKTHEYRVVYVLGTPLITLLKKVEEGTPVDLPWNHSHGSSFVTVNNPDNNRLRHTDVYERLTENDIIKHAHIVGVDIMYNKHDRTYRVCEFNFCPSLQIEDNVRKVVEHVQASHQLG